MQMQENYAKARVASRANMLELEQSCYTHENASVQTAYLPPEEKSVDTTLDIDYVAVSEGQQCSWFPAEITVMMMGSLEYPCFSHGFDKVLAEMHRRQPNLSYACATTKCPSRLLLFCICSRTHMHMMA